ncbi:carbohydrate-binding module family 19 protein [Drepanopeziza brunnea f. sp. 'multigermtubi' MB_m1]|uniref:Carbohydrate-binding module family 19 protein n=1 Tax=Marssonina brunnea f. sp. multigermtubi (strain MB_m1) TaxID=1072389 RepID=K1WPL7_MARBU|nr:carbohydrate-binding module family 19 protein [Drepanopeziza brunnea f. sp. 'multigermtubi' MB_m1]EKD14921.1 carbohydrate-binding module family 19 protein [Drepanopeziza brunnea f. sp. 'multigermtubi' MB_m1]
MARSFAFSNTSIPIRISTASVAGTSDTRTIIPVITSSDLSSLSSSVEYPSSTSIMLASLTDQTTDSHLSIPSSSSQFSPSSTAAKSSFASSRSIALVTSTSPPASLLSRPPSASPGNSTRLSTRPALSSSLPSSSAVERQSPSILSSPSPSASALKASAHRAAASFSLRITTGAASDLILMTVSPTRSVPSLRTQSAAATPSGQQDSSTSLPPTSSSIRTSIPASATLLPSPFTAVNPAPGSLTFSATSSTYSIPRFTLNNTRSIALPSFSTSRGLESGPATTILITIDLSSITASKPSTTPSTALSSSPSFVFVWTRSSLPASTISHIPTVIATPPAPTSTISAATFAANLAQAQGYNVLFSTLNFSSPCTDRQIACIGGSVGTCNNEGSFQITDVCEKGARCFALPMNSTSGVLVGCADVAAARSVLGLSLSPSSSSLGETRSATGLESTSSFASVSSVLESTAQVSPTLTSRTPDTCSTVETTAGPPPPTQSFASQTTPPLVQPTTSRRFASQTTLPLGQPTLLTSKSPLTSESAPSTSTFPYAPEPSASTTVVADPEPVPAPISTPTPNGPTSAEPISTIYTTIQPEQSTVTIILTKPLPLPTAPALAPASTSTSASSRTRDSGFLTIIPVPPPPPPPAPKPGPPSLGAGSRGDDDDGAGSSCEGKKERVTVTETETVTETVTEKETVTATATVIIAS